MDARVKEFRRHSYWCPRGHPEGTYRLDMFFDYGAFPVWGQAVVPPKGDRPERVVYGMAGPDLLGISPSLAKDLRAWADWKDRHSEYGGGEPATGTDHVAHWVRGRVLVDRLARETGAEVVYGKSGHADRDPDCPHCGVRRGRPAP